MRSLFFSPHTLLLCLAGALILFVGDIGHIQSGTAYYSGEQGPRFYDVPLWVLLEFFLAAWLLIGSYPWRRELFNLANRKVGRAEIVLATILMFFIYLCTSMSESFAIVKNVWLLLVIILQMKWSNSFQAGIIFDLIFIAMGGCLVEWSLGEVQIFNYNPSQSTVGLIPCWLPIIYLSAGMTAQITGEWIYLREKN